MPSTRKKAKVDASAVVASDAAAAAAAADDADATIDYERIRRENIERNSSFLATLGLDETKDTLDHLKARPVSSATQRGATKRHAPAAPAEPLRRSGRVTIGKLKSELEKLREDGTVDNVKVEEIEKELLNMVAGSAEGSTYREPVAESEAHARLPPDPISLRSPTNIDEEQMSSGEVPFINLALASIKVHPVSSKKHTTQKTIAELSLREEDVAKCTDSRITATYCHPYTHKLIIASGDKIGNVGLWDVDADSAGHGGVYRYRPRVSNIIGFHAWHDTPSRLHSVSYDGTLRIIDVEKEAFMLGFQIPEDLNDVYLSDACFSPWDTHSVLLGRSDGILSLADLRDTRSGQICGDYSWLHNVQQAKLNSVQFHPTNEHLVICGGSGKNGVITVHDLRSRGARQWKPLNTIDAHTKSINAAYCSPDGQYLVSVSLDNTVKVWRDFCSNNAVKANTTTLKHDNHTGRWLSTFRPVFDPKHEHLFALGSMGYPRCLELFTVDANSTGSISLNLMRNLTSDHLGSVLSRNCFHPTLNVVVGGNSSGRVHVFR